jgi:hypothetical protein
MAAGLEEETTFNPVWKCGLGPILYAITLIVTCVRNGHWDRAARRPPRTDLRRCDPPVLHLPQVIGIRWHSAHITLNDAT